MITIIFEEKIINSCSLLSLERRAAQQVLREKFPNGIALVCYSYKNGKNVQSVESMFWAAPLSCIVSKQKIVL